MIGSIIMHIFWSRNHCSESFSNWPVSHRIHVLLFCFFNHSTILSETWIDCFSPAFSSNCVHSFVSPFLPSTFPTENVDNFIYLFIYFINLFIYFLAVLGLRCRAQAFSSCGERGLLLLWSMGSRCSGFSSCGSRVLEHRLSSCGTWA